MDNPETLANKNGQSRDTGKQEWTIQRHWQTKHNITQTSKNMSNTDPTKTGRGVGDVGGEQRCSLILII
jgi:hypothetical protein